MGRVEQDLQYQRKESPHAARVTDAPRSSYDPLEGHVNTFQQEWDNPQSVSVSDRVYVCHDTVSKPNALHQVVRT